METEFGTKNLGQGTLAPAVTFVSVHLDPDLPLYSSNLF